VEEILRSFVSVKHVEIGFNRMADPERTVKLPSALETLILEANEISSLRVLDHLNAPR